MHYIFLTNTSSKLDDEYKAKYVESKVDEEDDESIWHFRIVIYEILKFEKELIIFLWKKWI